MFKLVRKIVVDVGFLVVQKVIKFGCSDKQRCICYECSNFIFYLISIVEGAGCSKSSLLRKVMGMMLF